MSINPKEDEIKIQAAVAVEVLSFLQTECRKRGGLLTLKDFEDFNVLNYGIQIPDHIPDNFADKVVQETCEMVLTALTQCIEDQKLEGLTNNIFTVMMRKFNTQFMYNMIKDSIDKGKGR